MRHSSRVFGKKKKKKKTKKQKNGTDTCDEPSPISSTATLQLVDRDALAR